MDDVSTTSLTVIRLEAKEIAHVKPIDDVSDKLLDGFIVPTGTNVKLFIGRDLVYLGRTGWNNPANSEAFSTRNSAKGDWKLILSKSGHFTLDFTIKRCEIEHQKFLDCKVQILVQLFDPLPLLEAGVGSIWEVSRTDLRKVFFPLIRGLVVDRFRQQIGGDPEQFSIEKMNHELEETLDELALPLGLRVARVTVYELIEDNRGAKEGQKSEIRFPSDDIFIHTSESQVIFKVNRFIDRFAMMSWAKINNHYLKKRELYQRICDQVDAGLLVKVKDRIGLIKEIRELDRDDIILESDYARIPRNIFLDGQQNKHGRDVFLSVMKLELDFCRYWLWLNLDRSHSPYFDEEVLVSELTRRCAQIDEAL